MTMHASQGDAGHRSGHGAPARLYLITASGERRAAPRNRESFKNWVARCMKRSRVRNVTWDDVTGYPPEDYPAMTEVIDDAVRECLNELTELSCRRRREIQGQTGEPMDIAVFAEMAGEWTKKLSWLHCLRAYLEHEYDRHDG